MSADEKAAFEHRIENRPNYVFVWQRGKAASVQELESVQAEIAAALSEANTRVVMFDNRETDTPDEWIRAKMWTWLSEHVDRAALLQNEVRNIRRAERTGELNRVVVRAFHDEADAEAWLVASIRKRSV